MQSGPRARAALFAAITLSCGPAGKGGTTTDATVGTSTTGATAATTGAGDGSERATLVHSFGVTELAAYEEREPCVQWTLANDRPIYVNTVTLVNDGGFHHSNWLAVPEDKFAGPDGYFDCAERNYTELEAAISGTVVFAQSTQSRHEVQALPAGVAIKIPPRHKIIAGVHLLNLASVGLDSELRMGLEIVHPRDVEVIAAPFRLTYFDLTIPPMSRSRFTGSCEIRQPYIDAVGGEFDLALYWVMPHTHYLGDHFRVEVVGGPNDGKVLHEKTGFDADANGAAFDPPVDLSQADGLRFFCGYDNWRDVQVGWGIGDQEMCVMLGLADSRAIMDIRVVDGGPVGVDGDVKLFEGGCDVLAFPENVEQTEPTAEEREGPLYVPPIDPADADLEPGKTCVDADESAPAKGPVTLDVVRDAVFTPGCVFSSCHDAKTPAAGLDLQTADGLRERLLGHAVAAPVDVPLVDPGDARGSWLYQLVSRCEPTDRTGKVRRHMPYNAPTLLTDGTVALIRAWIESEVD